jgi:hypothetical protein
MGMRLAAIPILLAAASSAAADFHVDVGIHFGVPQREVIVVREQRVPDYELPVVFLMARHARVAPAVIVDLRLGGMQWWDIAARYRVGPEVFYVPAGPPYGKAHGYWKKHRMTDAEMIDCANVRFLSEYHRVPPDRIYAMRSRGLGYTQVNAMLERGRGDDKHENRGHHGQGKARGHGKKH